MFTGNQEIIGYLTVDTLATGKFDRTFDFPIGALMADALFLFFESIGFAPIEATVEDMVPSN